MNAPTPVPSDAVSIDVLKAAFKRVREYHDLPIIVQLREAVGLTAAERDAWRTAFQWRDKFGPIGRLNDAELSEFHEGLRAINWRKR